MSIIAKEKGKIIKKYAVNDNDTGSPEVQIALLTAHINNLTEHMKEHKKDLHSRRGLLMKVNRRRKLLDYVKVVNYDRYQSIISGLNIRK